MNITEKCRAVEAEMAALFSSKRPFSEHLQKWEDTTLPDKYDHNCFEYSGQPTGEEFRLALEYQKKTGASFIKFEGNAPLEEPFGMELSVTLTMAFLPRETRWKKNPLLTFRKPTLPELEEIERKHFGAVYGEDFTVRNVRRLYEKLDYHGAYFGNKLVAACYSYSFNGITCLDGLIVDRSCRNQYVATTVIGSVRESHPGHILVLHADRDDTPKNMYLKMGFEIADSLYEYLRTDLSKLEV